jgi:hypothetical protein
MTKNLSHASPAFYAAGMSLLTALLTVLALHFPHQIRLKTDATHTTAAPLPPVRIALALDARLPVAVSRPAIEEAAALWAPHGVDIVPLEASAPCPLGDETIDAVLTVRITDLSVGPGALSSPFASTRFLPDGRPEPTILLHYEALTSMALGSVMLGGVQVSQWPPAGRDLVLARMIGRVLAHEIGHWLLRTRSHSSGGLMRAVHTTNELADFGRAGFVLVPADVVRLREVLTTRN